MWPIAIIVGILIAYFILKFTGPTKTTSYIPGISYYMSELKLTGSPLAEDDALVGAGLATRVKPSVMDSTSLSSAEMVIMSSRGSPMMDDEAMMAPPPMAPGPMMAPPPMAPGPMMAPSPMAPGPMMAPPPMAPGPMMAPPPMATRSSAPVTMSPSV